MYRNVIIRSFNIIQMTTKVCVTNIEYIMYNVQDLQCPLEQGCSSCYMWGLASPHHFIKRESLAHKTIKLVLPRHFFFIKVSVPSQESVVFFRDITSFYQFSIKFWKCSDSGVFYDLYFQESACINPGVWAVLFVISIFLFIVGMF